MKLSVICSIFNRSTLFSRGLRTLATQTLSATEWELIVVDDMSTEDIKSVLAPYKGQFNIRYIQYDRRLHPIWQELNPDGVEVNWRHTQAISANIGLWASTGEICCINQPEMLHSPESFATGWQRASQIKQIFGEVFWATEAFNDWLSGNDWQAYSFDSLLEIAQGFGEYYHPNHMPDQGFYEMYWYIEYFPRPHALGINGVDLAYQGGVFAEDDQFRVRLRRADCDDAWGGRPQLTGPAESAIVGIHQCHSHEEKLYPKQDRQGQSWNVAAERNRNLWRLFQEQPYTVANTNLTYSPWGEFTITQDEYWPCATYIPVGQ